MRIIKSVSQNSIFLYPMTIQTNKPRLSTFKQSEVFLMRVKKCFLRGFWNLHNIASIESFQLC